MTQRNDPFEDLHAALTAELLKKIRDGSATAADLNVARQWLKDNQVAADPSKNKPLRELTDSLPELPEED